MGLGADKIFFINANLASDMVVFQGNASAVNGQVSRTWNNLIGKERTVTAGVIAQTYA